MCVCLRVCDYSLCASVCVCVCDPARLKVLLAASAQKSQTTFCGIESDRKQLKVPPHKVGPNQLKVAISFRRFAAAVARAKRLPHVLLNVWDNTKMNIHIYTLCSNISVR